MDEEPAAVAAATAADEEQPTTIEEKIGLIWFTRIGALVGIMAAGWFFKYMVDNDWVGPWGRVAIGAVVGVVLLAWGELMSRGRRSHKVFVQGILGLGLSLLLITAFAASAFYDLLDTIPAFVAVAVLAALGGALSVRHRAESILVLSLLAIFLNPVVLSTGHDRPLALFTYLMLMTSGALAVASQMGFRVATWVALAGVFVLFGGWYQRFFDVSKPLAPELLLGAVHHNRGAYHELSARWVPLLFAALFPLQWVVTGLAARRRKHPHTSLALLLCSAVGAHAAFTALLFDNPVLLGGVLCAMGLGYALLFTRLDLGNWLGLPMVASFAVLAALAGEVEPARLLPMMAVTGGLSSIYFGVFFQRGLRDGKLHSPLALILCGGAGLGLLLLSVRLLMPAHYAVFGLLVAGVSLVYLVVWSVVGNPVLLGATFLVSVLGLALAASQAAPRETDLGLLAVSGGWFLLYAGFIAYDLLVRGADWSRGRLGVLTGVGIGFTSLFLLTTSPEAGLLRAALATGAGALYLMLGLKMMQAGAKGEDRALLPLGLALALFTMAVAFLLSGPGVTVVWAVEGAILAHLACRLTRRERVGHAGWLLFSAALFMVAGVRLFSLDWPWIGMQLQLFISSEGLQGTLLPTAFLHPRAWSLLAMGVALLLSARAFARLRPDPVFGPAALAALVLGHASLLALLVGEGHILFTTLPPPPAAGLKGEEFMSALTPTLNALSDQLTRRQMVTTVVMGSYAVALLIIGFALRERVHRLLGILLFGLTLAKLGLWDIWALETIYRIVVGGAIAALLLSGGFLYARFGNRIKTLLSEDEGKATLMLLLFLGGAALAPSTAHAELSPERFRKRAAITGVQGAGDHRLVLTPALYGASSAPSSVADVRVVGPSGAEVPFVVRLVHEPSPPTRIKARVLDPVLLPDGASQAVLDMGERPGRHSRLTMTIGGGDYLRRARVESSSDGQTFGLLADDARVFDIKAGGARAVRTFVSYPESAARYLRITLLPGVDRKQHLPITRAQVFLEARSADPASAHGTIQLSLVGQPVSKDGQTTYELSPLPAGVPLDLLVLAADGEFVRDAQVQVTSSRQAWLAAGRGTLYRVRDRAGTAGTTARLLEQLELSFDPGGRPLARLVIQDGDSPAVKITGAAARYPLRELVFRARSGGAHQLLIGAKEVSTPSYDLAALIRRGGTSALTVVQVGLLEPNPSFGKVKADDKPRPWTERHAGVLKILLGVVVLCLGAWTVWLLRRGRAGAGDGGAP